MTTVEPEPPVDGVPDLLTEFLDAFENLDVNRFLACWAKDATVFHPFPGMPKRVAGWEEVSGTWTVVFDHMRATLPGPPYLDLRPIDLDVRTVGSSVAVATFHLELDQGVGRRTLVVQSQAGSWKVVHLHASNV